MEQLRAADNESKQPKSHTTSPIVTGASVLAVKYKDGVMMISDTLASYGSMARFKSVQRIAKVNDFAMIGASGEYSDFQYIQELLGDLTDEEYDFDDGSTMSASQIHSYLSRVMYNRRSKVNPLYNQLVVAGYKNGGFLGSVDLYGSTFEENILATGYGMYMALPLLRKGWTADMDEKAAKALLEQSMTVLFYRDCRTINKYNIAKVTASGVEISKPYTLPTQWSYKRFVNPHLTE
mmetsp:Transcript_20876/g.37192  ORF Transcript_20876/g.37192 Transcript_20876/m.37192 type:complete len:236 (+) Transcript_20876:71-778(+)|eukprot:CAMPEP_0197524904 /NCGR_PEP_ID=MMETSP1318-20131121/10317_1 /TAXON_ID=552666 /ORGANISM="Partenskyella glossopodia, Strain RCC365" /LENGTH=235 /DNA_ID=CAMNT_0043078001 /DNA_START=48 /DNA_END=755 /DNA_ORIENTATION=-